MNVTLCRKCDRIVPVEMLNQPHQVAYNEHVMMACPGEGDRRVGIYDLMPLDAQEIVRRIVAFFHYRNGKVNEDGSLGEIRITPKQLQDAIADGMLQWQRKIHGH